MKRSLAAVLGFLALAASILASAADLARGMPAMAPAAYAAASNVTGVSLVRHGVVAVGDVQANLSGFAGSSDTDAGWTIGVGVEGVIANNWTAKLEYLYADIGDTTCSAAACGTATNVDLKMNIVRAGLNYRF